jgi:regulator of protease activity HflC (stomatin/prohibitin superfamily)
MKLLSLLLLFTLVSCGFEVVDTGRRGIKTNMGQIVGEPLPEGLQFYNPFTEDVVEMNIRESSESFKLEAYSKDNQQIHTVVNVVSAPNPKQIHTIFKEYGEDYFNVIAKPSIAAAVKDILGQYTADNIISERGKMQKEALLYVQTKLASRFIIITGVEFTDIKFQPEYENAVEAKVVAIQRAEQAKNKTEEVKEQKAQAILNAEAVAESIRIRSAALQQNAKLVEFEAIQKWNGAYPETLIINGSGNGAGTILSLPGRKQ